MENGGENSGNYVKNKLGKIKLDLKEFGVLTKQIVKDDPRRIVHSFKVGLAIALVSLFYYFDPLYEGFGVNAMWGVLTVVVVFEYSVGATIGKGLNRVVATVTGGWFAVGAHRLSSYWGDDWEPLLLGLSVLIISAMATFTRFYPKIKARFDYGAVIFILTFSLICVSGYRDDEVIDMAQRRITTILIGCLTAVLICVLIWPVWAGHDLHHLTASNIEKLGNFFEEFGIEYSKKSADVDLMDNIKSFQSIVDSKGSVDALINFAKWEPRHGRFKYRHPWSQYQKVCSLTRECACRAISLQNFIQSGTQGPKEVKAKLRQPCSNMSIESGKALKELSTAIKEMTQPSKAKIHIQTAKQATKELNLILTSNIVWENFNFLDITPAATTAALLNDVITCTQKLVEEVQVLATLVKFKSIDINSNNNELANSQFSTMESRSTNNYVIVVDGSSRPSTASFVSEDLDLPPSLAMAQHNAE